MFTKQPTRCFALAACWCVSFAILHKSDPFWKAKSFHCYLEARRKISVHKCVKGLIFFSEFLKVKIANEKQKVLIQEIFEFGCQIDIFKHSWLSVENGSIKGKVFRIHSINSKMFLALGLLACFLTSPVTEGKMFTEQTISCITSII